jgi:hypothetical protein
VFAKPRDRDVPEPTSALAPRDFPDLSKIVDADLGRSQEHRQVTGALRPWARWRYSIAYRSSDLSVKLGFFIRSTSFA